MAFDPTLSMAATTASASAAVPLDGAISEVTTTLPGCVVTVISSRDTSIEPLAVINSASVCLYACSCARKSISVPCSVAVKMTPGCATPGCAGLLSKPPRIRGINIASPTMVATNSNTRNGVRHFFHHEANVSRTRTRQGATMTVSVSKRFMPGSVSGAALSPFWETTTPTLVNL